MAFRRGALQLWRKLRQRQEDVDTWRLYQLLYYRENCGGKNVKIARPDENISPRKQKLYIKENITKQIEDLFARRDHVTKTPDSFSLKLQNPQAQDKQISGVHLSGHALPGTVICFYPGVVYLRTQVVEMPNFPFMSENNPYLMARSDGGVIDAMGYTSENPLAVGHQVRHPPAGVLPNLMPCSHDLSTQHSTHLQQWIPNRYYGNQDEYLGMFAWRRKLETPATKQTIVFVAMRHLDNEELYLNYRLHPKTRRPSWYTSVDEEEDQRRWRKVPFLP